VADVAATAVGEGVGSGVPVEASGGMLVGVGEGEITALHASTASARAVTADAFLIDAISV
jgi:hypothetical protein